MSLCLPSVLYLVYVLTFPSPGAHSTGALKDSLPYFIFFSQGGDHTAWNHRRCIPICFVGLQIPCGQIVFCPLSLSESLLSGLKNRNSFTSRFFFFLGPKRTKTLYNTLPVFSVEGENNYQCDLIFKRLLTLLKDMGEELKPTSKRNYSVHQRVEVSCL